LNYQSDKIITKISFQDVGIWGSEALKTNVPDIGLYEGWAQIPLFDSLSIKVGKQEIIYDNKRLFAANDWLQQGSTHNAVMLKYCKNGFKIDLTGAYNQSSDKLFGTDYLGFPNNYKTLNILWISKKFTDNFTASALGVADGFQKTNSPNTMYMRGTFGGIIKYDKTDNYSAAIRGFYQDGRDTSGKQISAYYLSADFTYTLNKKFTIWLGMQYVSGNDATNTYNKENNAFNTLYGSAHSFTGSMDYFSDIAKNTKGAGIVDPYLNLIYKFSDKASARLDMHYLMLQNNYVVNTSIIDKHLGDEGDLSFNYFIRSDVTLTAGFSLMLATKSMEVVGGGNSMYPGGWGFIMLTIKPTFFSSEKK
jgi:hypothetical protein